eukprot:gb/GEZN01024657.1/.p1 GENE.gb/GEZN01024657.1/~~gb/GEZN01024657.1/.p1  ORF type:complete len:171 (+),score=2.61 gb/GEZN01024657.1/:25-537(+)
MATQRREAKESSDEKIVEIAKGLTKRIMQEGKGEVVPEGHYVSVHYTGTLTDGTQFDSSRQHGKPFQFKLGARNVILGWDLGVATMRLGERAMLTCSSDYGYGSSGTGPIPGNATLNFDIEVLGHQEGATFEFPWTIVITIMCLLAIFLKPMGYDWTKLITALFPFLAPK